MTLQRNSLVNPDSWFGFIFGTGAAGDVNRLKSNRMESGGDHQSSPLNADHWPFAKLSGIAQAEGS
jgi:hypothetical protein